MISKSFSVGGLLTYLEDVLANRHLFWDHWWDVWVNDDRNVTLLIAADELWMSGATNYELNPAEWLTPQHEAQLQDLRWLPDTETGPRFVRRWPGDAPTSAVLANFMQVLTSVYMHNTDEAVDVLPGVIAEGWIDWDESADR